MSGLAATLARRRRPLRRALPAMSARLRRRLLALVLLTLALAGGYWFWLRDSSLVAVDEVSVTGLSTEDSERVRLALMATAKRMTTLHVDRERLEQAVAPYPVVRALEVTTDFPHGMRIRVIEHEPAAMAVSDGARLPVAGDGTILRGMPVEGHLPLVEVEGALAGDRLREATARAAATIAGAAPALLRRRVEQIEKRPELGLVAELREGPELIFGDGARARAKWAAAARVLADPEARGASYIDLRIPSRPAAGGLPAATVAPVAPAGLTPPATTTAPPAGGATAEPGTTVDPAVPAAPTDPATGVPESSTPVTPTTPPPDPLTGGAEGGAVAPTTP